MAARAFQIISVAPTLVEGIEVQRGEARLNTGFSHPLPPSSSDPLVHLLQHLDARLESVEWNGTPVAIVLPSEEVSIRRLEFPFKEPKQIAQAMVFELENELLEDVDSFVYDFSILPNPDNSSAVLIYLVHKDYLEALLDVCRARGLRPIQATFSADALQRSHPPQGERHYYLYVGLDEVFVSFVSGKNLVAVNSLTLDLAELNDSLGEHRFESTEAMMMNLNGGHGEDSPAGAALESRLRVELAGLAQQVMRFIHPHASGNPYTLSIHGVFAAMFLWNSASQELAVPEGEQPPMAFPGGRYFGILGELNADPSLLTAPGGINFHHGGSVWWSQLKDYKSSLMVTGGLLLATLMLLGFSYGSRIVHLQSRLSSLEGKIQRIVKKHVKGNHSVVIGVRLLEEKLNSSRKDGAASARFASYRFEKMELLKALSALFLAHPQISLTSLNITVERLILSGTTASYKDSESLKNGLLELKPFQGKEPTVTHQRTSDNITFRLVIER